MTHFDMPASVCPDCGYEMDSATGTDASSGKPKPGDPSLCIECGAFLVFQDDLTLRRPTSAEQRAWGPDVRWSLQRTRATIRRMRKKA